MKEPQPSNPRQHAQQIRSELQALTEHLRNDVDRTDAPQAKALFETSAEVLGGLAKAFAHYEQQREEA